jgi:magnesium chelatase family protein
VLAANPCPCARPEGDRTCECSRLTRRRYLARLSGPLLDRVDLQVTLVPVPSAALLADRSPAEASATVAARVRTARSAASARWTGGGAGVVCNADVTGAMLRDRRFRLPRSVTGGLASVLDQGHLSARGYDRVLKVAWTICDLDGRDRPDTGDVAEALELRKGTAV